MKRILTVQDFSCVGKCSLTVALPVLSAFGIETCALPTALLSTHTAFAHWSKQDLATQMQTIADKWQKENIRFDGLYTGYLGSIDSVRQTQYILQNFVNEGSLVLVDPVMGDHGKLYSGFDQAYVDAMRVLCAHADLVTPNLTEAAMLAGMTPVLDPSADQLDALLAALTPLCGNVIVTGVRKEDKIGVVCALNGTRVEYFTAAAQDMHGAGDLFAATLYGALLNDKPLPKAIAFACEFCKDCLLYSQSDPTAPAYGVSFEPLLYKIHDCLEK